MTTQRTIAPNAWHHHEKVYVQARAGDSVLVQYVDRALISPVLTAGYHGPRLQPLCPWAWLPKDDVMLFSDLDAQLLKTWQRA